MAKRDPQRQIARLLSEISSLNSRILENVYHRAWDRDLLRGLQGELEEKKARLERIRSNPNVGPPRTPRLTGHVAGEGEPLKVHDTRLVANALYTQRPLIYASDEWQAYRRVCASLVRLFAHELESTGEFDKVEFLTHCGLSLADAEEIARRPGDFIRRTEEPFRDHER